VNLINEYQKPSPFGSVLSGRAGNSSLYRYAGAGGQELDNEILGTGNSYTAEYWQYDSRLGRRWNIDPMSNKYAWQSPYVVFNNNPIFFIDPFGLEGTEPEKGYTCTDENNNNIVYSGNGEWKDFKEYNTSNLYVMIRRTDHLEYVGSAKGTHVTNEGVFMLSSSFEDAYNNIKKLYGENSPEYVFLNVHGQHGYHDDAFGNRIYDDQVTINDDDAHSFDRYDLKKYNSGTLSGIKKREIDAFYGIVNLTQKGGSVLLASCLAGSDELLVDRIAKGYKKKTNQQVNLYMNGDKTSFRTMDNGLCYMGKLLLNKKVIEGWLLINAAGVHKLIDQENKTGNIIYNGQDKIPFYEQTK